MNNKIKKQFVALLMGITLCGSVLTVQAANPRSCGHTSTSVTVSTYNEIYYHTYTMNSVTYNCKITVPHTKTVVTCKDCNAILSTKDIAGTASHQYNH